MTAHSYIVPDYYSDFQCKGAICSHTCCTGWRITISQQKYFLLLGLKCSKELRKKLDRALCICEYPTPERYAQIVPTWEGDCPAHNENGLCALQVECGERVLTEACRYYPRSMRSEYRYECSCANSCEAVVEMLLFRKDPIKFKRINLSFCREEDPINFRLSKKARQIADVRNICIKILEDRSHSFPERMIKLGRLISELSNNKITYVSKLAGSLPQIVYPENENHAIKILHNLISWFKENKPECAVHEYLIETQIYLGVYGLGELDDASTAEAAEKYHIARTAFREAYPDFSTMSEQIIVNHVFYTGFPYSTMNDGLWEEYMALCAVYTFVRLLKICCYMRGGGDRKIVDVIAAAFRLIEHSGFDHNAAILLRRAGCVTPENLAALLMI